MKFKIGNAPCSWGVEFADDPRNPPWRRVVQECAEAGYQGIELGPVGYLPEDPGALADALAEHQLELIGGVVFRPFHDPNAWDDVLDAAKRTCEALVAHGARHLVLIDSISERRAPTAGRPTEAEQLDAGAWAGLVDRVRTVARLGAEEHGLTVSLHPHAAGFIEFAFEVERVLAKIDADVLKLCVDTGHFAYAGDDPMAFMRAHAERLAYVHFKSTDAAVRAKVVAERIGFYDACASGLFARLSEGEIDFPAVKRLLEDIGYQGWCTVEQDCDPESGVSPAQDAKANRDFLRTIGF